MSQGLKVASIYADLKLDSGHLERGLANARTAMTAAEREILSLKEAVAQGAIGFGDAQKRIMELDQTINKLAASSRAAYGALSVTNGGLDLVGQGMKSGAGGADHFSMALMQLGAAVDDAQYGFRGVLNNIPLIVSGMAQAAGAAPAMGMAIAGGASIAVTAIYQLIQHWDELMQAFGLGIPEQVKLEFQDLAEEVANVGLNTERLKKIIGKREHKREEMEGRVSQKDKEVAHAWEDAHGEIGTARMTGGLATQIQDKEGAYHATEEEKEVVRREVRAANPWLRAGANTATGITMGGTAGIVKDNPLWEEMRRREDVAIAQYERERDAQRGQNLMLEAEGTGPNAHAARQKIKEMVKQNPGLYPQGTLEELERAETGKTKKQAEQEAKQKATKDAADEKKKLDDAREFEEEAQRHIHQAAKPLVHGITKGGNAIEQKLLANPNANITNDVRAQMVAMGWSPNKINALLEATVKDVREAVRNKVDQYAAEHGITNKEAGERIDKQEMRKRDRALEGADKRVREGQEKVDDMKWKYSERIREHNKPQFMGLTDYAKKLAVGGFETEHWQRDTLKMQREIVDATNDVKKAIEDQQAVKDQWR